MKVQANTINGIYEVTEFDMDESSVMLSNTFIRCLDSGFDGDIATNLNFEEVEKLDKEYGIKKL
jgi:hypothetical protein